MRILCFGDSNTWGYVPGGNGARYPAALRLATRLDVHLSGQATVIEDGLRGRTTNIDDPEVAGRNGAQALPGLLARHAPLDVVVIMLGTNDLKRQFARSADTIAAGVGELLAIVAGTASLPTQTTRTGTAASPMPLVVAPPLLANGAHSGHFDGRQADSLALAPALARLADRHGVRFVDGTKVTTCPNPDGVHLDAASIDRLARDLARAVIATCTSPPTG